MALIVMLDVAIAVGAWLFLIERAPSGLQRIAVVVLLPAGPIYWTAHRR